MLGGVDEGQAAGHRVADDDGAVDAEIVEVATQQGGEAVERHGGATALAVSGQIDGDAEDVADETVDDWVPGAPVEREPVEQYDRNTAAGQLVGERAGTWLGDRHGSLLGLT